MTFYNTLQQLVIFWHFNSIMYDIQSLLQRCVQSKH